MLRLASFATAGAELVPPALARVRAALPDLEITLRIAERDEALALLRRGLLDVAVIEAHAIPPAASSRSARRPPSPGSTSGARSAAAATPPAPPSSRPDSSPAAWWKPTSTGRLPGFVAAGLGLALIPALALGVLHPGVAVRRLRPATQPERHVLAVTRPAISDTTPVQAILTALQAHATPQPGSTP